ncbi:MULTISPECIES: papain-like cysteine protease family protein [Pseudomonas syringae group]|nr:MULTISPECIES: papain-like cysteine protease family protein [Pseudomonas syringae group]
MMKIAPVAINHSPLSREVPSHAATTQAKQTNLQSEAGDLDARKSSASSPETRALLATKTVLGRHKIEVPAFGGWFKKKSSKHETGGSSANADSSSVASDSTEKPLFRLTHVPYVSQGNERMGCWYACARMVGHSVEAGPRLGLPELYEGREGPAGLQDFSDVERFIHNEGLTRVDLPDNERFTHEELGALLYKHGPIIFGWKTPNDSWHMSVLTGVDKETSSITFHDPRQGPDLAMPLDYFNQRLAWQVPHAMLYR